MPLEPRMYPRGLRCPTRSLDSRRNFDGTDYVPASMAFAKERSNYFGQFSELDLVRLCRLRMNQFLDFDQLMLGGIINKGGFFAVHRWRRVSMFDKSRMERPSAAKSYPHGWSRLMDICQWPGDQHLHHIREYFGEEVAFYFHWLSFFTAYLIIPTLAGLLVAVLRLTPLLSERPKVASAVDISFIVVVILWSSTFGEFYNRRMQTHIEAWGMRDYQAQEVERPTFRKDRIGTTVEDCRRISHWFGIVVVIAWTVAFNYTLSSMRAEMLRHPEQVFWLGQPGKVCEKFAKYINTINITVVDAIWGNVSPYLSKKENHRTSVELRDAMVMKLIFVKVFVYYYPFWYIAFAQKYIEGCDIGGTTCLEYLEESLLVFVFLHIAYVMVMALVSLWTTRFSIWKETRGAAGKQYTYLEAQAKCPSYTPEAEIADFLELITSLGLVMQFTIIMPVIPSLQLISNLVELRITAYKMVHIYKRVPGRGSEGIGPWSTSIYSISWLALIVNVGLGVFFMKPMSEWDLQTQLLHFVIVEHALIGLKILVEIAIPDVDTLTHMIKVTNSVVLEKIFSGDKGSPVMVQGPRQVPIMSLTYDEEDQRHSLVSHLGLHHHSADIPWLRAGEVKPRTCANGQDWSVCGLSKRGTASVDTPSKTVSHGE